MAAHVLPRARAEALRAAPFSYEGVGATAHQAPQGYETLSRSRLPARRDFASAVEDLMTWRVHEQAGLDVAASSPRVEEGTVVMLRLGVAPSRYEHHPGSSTSSTSLGEAALPTAGTLPGHPESGEELFVIDQRDDGQLAFTITAFSKPVSATAKLGGPLTRRLQHAMTMRYLRALDRLGQ